VERLLAFAFHGYPWLIHRLTYRRTNHRNLHVRGDKEEGTITTAFDMRAKLAQHHAYIRQCGQDLPEILHWKWPG
jgi:xylulose-5-phosphate/fructose-6-phosphate phosphoketolase